MGKRHRQQLVRAQPGIIAVGAVHHIEEIAGGKYRLGGWVDLIVDEGRVERQHFSCTIHRDDNGGWIAEDVSVTPQ